MAVDTIFFVWVIGQDWPTGKTVLAVEKALMKAYSLPKFLVDAHHYLILHGRYTCTARQPKCGACVVFDECMFKDKEQWALKDLS